MSAEAWIGPAIIAAAIAAAINIVGWVVTGQRELRRDRRRRAERRADVQTALRAEIQHYVDILSNPEFDLMDSWAEVVNLMEADENYVPVVPSERNDTVFRAFVAELHILPDTTIGPVVRYYNQVFAIDAMIDDIRSAGFTAMGQDQRIKMYTDYISLKLEAQKQGKAAIAALTHSLTGSGKNAEESISNRVAARSAQQ